MTLLEIAAAAIDEQITAIYGSPPDRGEAEKIARAALLALAEAELPESLMDIALDTQASDGDDRHCFERGHFRAMCRAIAESGR